MKDDAIIKQRISGCSLREIAKSRRVNVAEINEAIDRWADQAITDKARKHGLALELARLDELQELFYLRFRVAALVTKIIERRCTMLGLHTPRTAVLQIVDEAKPKETSTDRIERVLAELCAHRKEDDPTTH